MHRAPQRVDNTISRGEHALQANDKPSPREEEIIIYAKTAREGRQKSALINNIANRGTYIDGARTTSQPETISAALSAKT